MLSDFGRYNQCFPLVAKIEISTGLVRFECKDILLNMSEMRDKSGDK